ncbi:MAG: GIY-YIG nuclease family protein, partial [Sphingomonas sp.]|nr:GIY-YIG nuclease family protein [Sphingomonas sp.]
MPLLKDPRMPTRRRVADIDTKSAPDETIELRRALEQFKRQKLSDFFDQAPVTKAGVSISVGAVKWGVYA